MNDRGSDAADAASLPFSFAPQALWSFWIYGLAKAARRIFDVCRRDDAKMIKRIVCSLAVGAVLSFGLCGASQAEKKSDDPTEARFQKLEKQVHELRSIITQARDTGQAVTVRLTTDPDPTLDALQSRLDDLEQAARTRNDQIDTLTHSLEAARKDAADARGQVKALEERLARDEARSKAQDDATSAPANDYNAPPPAGPPHEPTRYVAPPAQAAAPAASDADEAFKRARQLLLEGQYVAAGNAFQGFVDSYGDTANGPEAHYWLGETLYIRGLYADAATAYIDSIRGWPQTRWAPDAVVKLARSLTALNKAPDACRTLTEFDRRYPAATAPAKAKAADARLAAKCA